MDGAEPDFESWAAEPKGSYCSTCREYAEALPYIRRFGERKAERSTDKSWRQFVDEFLKPRYGYKYTDGAVRIHVQKCEPELWARIQGKT